MRNVGKNRRCTCLVVLFARPAVFDVRNIKAIMHCMLHFDQCHVFVHLDGAVCYILVRAHSLILSRRRECTSKRAASLHQAFCSRREQASCKIYPLPLASVIVCGNNQGTIATFCKLRLFVSGNVHPRFCVIDPQRSLVCSHMVVCYSPAILHYCYI